MTETSDHAESSREGTTQCDSSESVAKSIDDKLVFLAARMTDDELVNTTRMRMTDIEAPLTSHSAKMIPTHPSIAHDDESTHLASLSLSSEKRRSDDISSSSKPKSKLISSMAKTKTMSADSLFASDSQKKLSASQSSSKKSDGSSQSTRLSNSKQQQSQMELDHRIHLTRELLMESMLTEDLASKSRLKQGLIHFYRAWLSPAQWRWNDDDAQYEDDLDEDCAPLLMLKCVLSLFRLTKPMEPSSYHHECSTPVAVLSDETLALGTPTPPPISSDQIAIIKDTEMLFDCGESRISLTPNELKRLKLKLVQFVVEWKKLYWFEDWGNSRIKPKMDALLKEFADEMNEICSIKSDEDDSIAGLTTIKSTGVCLLLEGNPKLVQSLIQKMSDEPRHRRKNDTIEEHYSLLHHFEKVCVWSHPVSKITKSTALKTSAAPFTKIPDSFLYSGVSSTMKSHTDRVRTKTMDSINHAMIPKLPHSKSMADSGTLQRKRGSSLGSMIEPLMDSSVGSGGGTARRVSRDDSGLDLVGLSSEVITMHKKAKKKRHRPYLLKAAARTFSPSSSKKKTKQQQQQRRHTTADHHSSHGIGHFFGKFFHSAEGSSSSAAVSSESSKQRATTLTAVSSAPDGSSFERRIQKKKKKQTMMKDELCCSDDLFDDMDQVFDFSDHKEEEEEAEQSVKTGSSSTSSAAMLIGPEFNIKSVRDRWPHLTAMMDQTGRDGETLVFVMDQSSKDINDEIEFRHGLYNNVVYLTRRMVHSPDSLAFKNEVRFSPVFIARELCCLNCDLYSRITARDFGRQCWLHKSDDPLQRWWEYSPFINQIISQWNIQTKWVEFSLLKCRKNVSQFNMVFLTFFQIAQHSLKLRDYHTFTSIHGGLTKSRICNLRKYLGITDEKLNRMLESVSGGGGAFSGRSDGSDDSDSSKKGGGGSTIWNRFLRYPGWANKHIAELQHESIHGCLPMVSLFTKVFFAIEEADNKQWMIERVKNDDDNDDESEKELRYDDPLANTKTRMMMIKRSKIELMTATFQYLDRLLSDMRKGPDFELVMDMHRYRDRVELQWHLAIEFQICEGITDDHLHDLMQECRNAYFECQTR